MTLPRKRSVLIVDDNVELAEDLAEVLVLEGMDADFVGGGDAALERLGRRAYDVIVTDLKMPGMSGVELIERLASTAPSVPVVLITGFIGGDPLAGLPAGCRVDLLEKPFAPDTLVAHIHRAGERPRRPLSKAC